MTRLSLPLLLASTIWLTGCTTVLYRPAQLPLPARPTLPAVPSTAVQCLAPPTYSALVLRERGLKAWGLELEAVIKANNGRANAKP